MRTIFALFAIFLMFLNTPSFACDTCYEPTEIDKSIVISVDGKELTGVEYIKEYVTMCTYVPEMKKFVVHKCNQEKRASSSTTVKKGHHRDGHGGSRASSSAFRHRKVQWLKCTDCGLYLRGYPEGAKHFECTGHKHFQRIDF